MDQFFYSDQIYNDFIILDEDEALHALKVLRKQNGDQIVVVDGKGNLYHTLISSNNIKECKLDIVSIEENYKHLDYFIHIGISPPKSHDRIEIFIEKVVELGVHEISFILTEHSQRNNIKLNRIQKRAVSAMKQSLKAFLPQINDMVPMVDFMKNCENSEKYLSHINGDENMHLIDCASKNRDYCILIGPEGGFSNSEINTSIDFNFKPVSLGNSRLRTETAAISACHILNLVNERNGAY